MPIYEFYCDRCNTIFNFFSRRVNTSKVPACPRCQKPRLDRRMSSFAVTGRAGEQDRSDDPPMDQEAMEKAMHLLAGEAGKLDEDDPRQAARLMRRFTEMTGLELGDGMQEALRRMEQGEDPERIEDELADVLENEEPFMPPVSSGGKGGIKPGPPARDETLYEL